MLPLDGKQWVVPLIAALATTLTDEGERGVDEDIAPVLDAARST